jgi:hypothetical protein
MPATSGSRTRSIIGRAWPSNTTSPVAAAMPHCGDEAIATAVPCAPSSTASCRWPVPCWDGTVCSTPPTRLGRPSLRESSVPIPLFDRRRPSLRPDLPIGRAPRAAAVRDAAREAAAPAKPARSVLDRASKVLSFGRRDNRGSTPLCGVTAPHFPLAHWWGVLSP